MRSLYHTECYKTVKKSDEFQKSDIENKGLIVDDYCTI